MCRKGDGENQGEGKPEFGVDSFLLACSQFQHWKPSAQGDLSVLDSPGQLAPLLGDTEGHGGERPPMTMSSNFLILYKWKLRCSGVLEKHNMGLRSS